jgi:hypothetical protein
LIDDPRHHRAECEIEEVHLHERRRIAEKLNVALHESLQHAMPACLQPGANNADNHTEDDTDRRQLDRRPHAAQQPAALELIVEMDEIEPVSVVQRTQGIPKGIHQATVSRPGCGLGAN